MPEDARPDPKPKSKRGGPRPGSGAPKGNLNALKHGMRSKQFAAIGKLMAESPEVRYMLLKLAEREGKKHRKAELVAASLFARLIEYAKQHGGGGLNALTQTPEWRSINREIAGVDTPEGLLPSQTPKPRRKQPNTRHNPRQTTENQTRKPIG